LSLSDEGFPKTRRGINICKTPHSTIDHND